MSTATRPSGTADMSACSPCSVSSIFRGFLVEWDRSIIEIEGCFWREAAGTQSFVGVAVGFKVKGGEKTGVLSIRVLVKKKRSKLWMRFFSPQHVVLTEIEGLPTDVVEVGQIKALQKKRTEKSKPAPVGVWLQANRSLSLRVRSGFRQGWRSCEVSC